MRHLSVMLDSGTHGTLAEPTPVARRVSRNARRDQPLTSIGTRGTHGTPMIERADTRDGLAQCITDLADAYAERIAILLEAGDICEAEAHRMAEAEIGRRCVEAFMLDEVAAFVDRSIPSNTRNAA